jgi:FtsP/CotA-like multicopper oxidase with cupredoxin domain
MLCVQPQSIRRRGVGLAPRLAWLGLLAACAAAPHAAGAQAPLADPPVLENLSSAPHTVEVRLTAAPARVSLLPGTMTSVYAYNGHIPGPTLEVHEGDRVIVHFQNHLPEPTTVHWHGIHLPADMDGSPLDPVLPGGTYDYVFTLPPGTAGTYWYHPHPHMRTGFQVAMGLYGAPRPSCPGSPARSPPREAADPDR